MKIILRIYLIKTSLDKSSNQVCNTKTKDIVSIQQNIISNNSQNNFGWNPEVL